MKRINMLSKADMVKGQGVLSAHDEQVELAREVMKDRALIRENSREASEITHYHSINPEFYLSAFWRRRQGALVGYVHFLPETVENSISLPRFAKNIFYKYMISFYKRMDYLVTVNPVFIDKLADYGIPSEKVTYIPNVVSEKNFYPLGKEEKMKAREKYEESAQRPLQYCVQDSCREEKESLISWMWQKKCRSVSLCGQEAFLSERFLRGTRKLKPEWKTFRKT